MKCNYCGNELEKGAQFCPECGTLMSAEYETENEDIVVEQEENVFSGEKYKNEEPKVELEQKAINNELFEDVFEEEVAQDTADNDESQEENIEEQLVFEDINSHSSEDEAKSKKVDYTVDLYSFSDESNYEDRAIIKSSDDETEDEAETEDVAVNAAQGDIEPDNDMNLNDSYKQFQEQDDEVGAISKPFAPAPKSNNKGKKRIAPIVIALIVCMGLGASAYFVLPTIIDKDPTTTAVDATAEKEDPTEDKTESKTDEAVDDTTDESTSTTEKDVIIDQDTTVPSTTEKVPTAAPTTEKVPTTTAPTTTAPTTTTKVPTTTAKVPTTTAKVPTTTPTTTKAPTTDPYGITDAKVQKPSKMLATTKTLYITDEGVILRNKPSSDYERVLYLSKAADVVAYAYENGYYYVKSNRYGVYGWVSEKYAKTERPQADSTNKVDGLVAPDKEYSSAKIMYVNSSVGLNLRKSPSANGAKIMLIPNNYQVKVIGYSSSVSGWVYVIDTAYGNAGWVSSQYLKS